MEEEEGVAAYEAVEEEEEETEKEKEAVVEST